MATAKNKQYANKSRNNQQHNKTAVKPQAVQTGQRSTLREEWQKSITWWPYFITWALIMLFCTAIYGDVFTRAQQEAFVSDSPLSMQYLLNKDYGQLYWIGRFIMLVWKTTLTGSLFMATVLALATYALDRALRMPQFLRGISALLSWGLLLWMVFRGYSLFYKNEPSAIVLYPLFLMAGSLLLWGITALVGKFAKKENNGVEKTEKAWSKWNVIPFILPLLFFGTLTTTTLLRNDNEILTARMQNRLFTFDINEIGALVDDAQLAEQPSRSVAAYHAIGLIHTNQMLEGLFDIEYAYPEMKLDKKDGFEEYGVFQSDANLFSGLLNSAYRTSMDHNVMNGATAYNLKRMAICAILNNEPALAEKYLTIIDQMPFEGKFVEKFRAMNADRTLVEQDPLFAQILKLVPREKRFEQNYRQPVFMGYNIGVLEGNNETLPISIAACLYSKDFSTLIERAQALKASRGGFLPNNVLEALAIRGMSKPEVYKAFPELNPDNQTMGNNATSTLYTFLKDIQAYYESKYSPNEWQDSLKAGIKGGVPAEVAKTLKEEWLGHYFYYYYCENLVKKEEKSDQNNAGVN